MAVREILLYPKDKSALRAQSQAVHDFNRNTRRLIGDLEDTLLSRSDGVGLAAPQINVRLRVVVVRLGAMDDWDSEAEAPIAMVNPEIIEAADERKDFDGCLSFPGLFGQTVRPHYLRVKGLDDRGYPFDRIFLGFDAVLVHHEMDHLDGVLSIDRIESIKDLYRLYIDDKGKPVQVPVSEIIVASSVIDL